MTTPDDLMGEARKLFAELDRTRTGQGAVIAKALKEAESRGYLRGLEDARKIVLGGKK